MKKSVSRTALAALDLCLFLAAGASGFPGFADLGGGLALAGEAGSGKDADSNLVGYKGFIRSVMPGGILKMAGVSDYYGYPEIVGMPMRDEDGEPVDFQEILDRASGRVLILHVCNPITTPCVIFIMEGKYVVKRISGLTGYDEIEEALLELL